MQYCTHFTSIQDMDRHKHRGTEFKNFVEAGAATLGSAFQNIHKSFLRSLKRGSYDVNHSLQGTYLRDSIVMGTIEERYHTLFGNSHSLMRYVRESVIGRDFTFETPFGFRKG